MSKDAIGRGSSKEGMAAVVVMTSWDVATRAGDHNRMRFWSRVVVTVLAGQPCRWSRAEHYAEVNSSGDGRSREKRECVTRMHRGYCG
jgi:hypothetical protein